jgi:hypothetical protein
VVTEVADRFFLSHAAADDWVARQISDRIKRAGFECFVAPFDIVGGDEWDERIRNELSDSTALIALLTPVALSRPFVWVEIGHAWVAHKPLVCVLYGLTSRDLREQPEVPPLILSYQHIDINRELDGYLDSLSTADVGE